MKIGISALFFPLLSNIYLINTEYSKLKDITMQSHSEISIVISGYDVELELYSQAGVYDLNYIRFNFIESSNLVLKFAKQQGMTPHECRAVKKLEFYDIDWNVLNQPNRFSWINDASKIQALYDPRVDEQNIASIIVTNKGSNNPILIAHESAHYWYDRLCLYEGWSGSIEDFAVDFEDFYSKRRAE